jgi:hypothetical protein
LNQYFSAARIAGDSAVPPISWFNSPIRCPCPALPTTRARRNGRDQDLSLGAIVSLIHASTPDPCLAARHAQAESQPTL